MAYMDDLLRELEARGATGKIYNAGSSSSQKTSSTQKKKKKEYTEELLTILSQEASKSGNTLNLPNYGTVGMDTFKAKDDDDDIAPVKKIEQEDDSLLDFFQKGALGEIDLRKNFRDGYQFGDVLKTGGQVAAQVGKAILGTAGDVGLGVAKGFASTAEGIVDLASYGIAAGLDAAGRDASAKQWRKNASENTVEEWTEGADEFLNRYSVAGRTTDAISQGVGQIGSIIATGGLGKAAGLGAKAVTALTTGTLGVSGMGSGMGEAYRGGATDEEAATYGLISGASDALTELLFGGLGKAVGAVGLSKGLSSADDLLAKKVSGLFTNQIAKNFAEYGIKAGAEGFEEVLAGTAQAIGKKITYMKEEELSEILKDENLLEQFVVGAATSGMIQSGIIPGTSEGSLREANATGRDFITGFTQNEQSVIDKEVEKRVAEQEKGGKKLTKKEIGAIEKTVQEDMDKGFISIDTIEEVLGGETYTSYKKVAEAEDAMQREYDELGKKEHYTLADDTRYRELGDRLKYVREKGARSELKKRLDADVAAMVKDSRLAESFAERSRRGQTFEADVTQYDAKQQAIVQKAIDSGILNNTRRTHEFVDMVARIGAERGISFDFTNNSKLKESGFAVEGKTVNGFVTKDGITVNIQSAKSLNSVVGHEITHVLEGTELYAELQKAVFQYAESKKDLAGRRGTLTALYQNIEDADIDAELTADLVGDYLFTDSDFINNLSTNHRNVFQKIYDEVKYLLKMATAGSKEARELEKVKRAFEKAYREGGKKTAEDGGTQYSLATVEAVQPKSEAWHRGASTDEVRAAHPTLYAVDETATEERNPTQVKGTVSSYRKVYSALQAEGFDGTVLDASSGLGYGTKAGIEEFGFDVEDIEPYPDKNYRPKHTDYSALNKKYDVIISNAVLNVLPQDQRDALVVKMGELLNEGGRIFINVRGKDVLNASGKIAIDEAGMEYFIPRTAKTGSYQKGFTKPELIAYLQDALGDGFTVTSGSKVFGGSTPTAIVTKKGGTKYSLNEVTEDGLTMTYVRVPNQNTQNYGSTYGQNIEPAGEYMSMDTMQGSHKIDGYEYGTIQFKKPLVLEHINTGATGWKKTVSDMYGGLTGKKLSAALIKDGYDAIVTYDEYGYSEIVNLNGTKLYNPQSGAKYSLATDSEGRQLSAEQREYFRDSKVVDESGNLLVVYHGSKTGGFHTFKYSKDVQTGTDYGEAYYFTSDQQKASGYSYDVTKDERVARYHADRDALMRRFLETRAEADKNAFSNYRLDGKDLFELMDDEAYLTEGGEVKEVYLNLANPLIVDAGGEYYYKVYPEYFAQARKNGNDGIIVKNVIDNPRGEARPIDVYIAFRPEQIKAIDNTNPTTSPDIRYSLSEYSEEEKKAHNAAALEHFGKTYRWAETGYLLLDGTRLDLSGKRFGAPGGYRTVDHRDIADALGADYGDGSYSGALMQFMSEGNIRISPESNGINLSVLPTKAQESSLSAFISSVRGEVLLDIDDYEGDTVLSIEYPKYTHANKVLADIRAWFESGATPEVEGGSVFRRSLSAVGEERYTFGNYNVYGEDVALEGAEDIAPVRQDIAPATVSKNATVADAPVQEATYEEPEQAESPYAEIDRLEAQLEEMERQYEATFDADDHETAEALLAEMVQPAVRLTELMNQLDAEERDRLASFEDADAPAVREVPYSESADTVTLPKKMVQSITKEVREALGFSARRSAEMRQLIEKFSQGEIDSEMLYDEIAERFGTYTETERLEDIAEVKKWLRDTPLHVTDDIKADFADYTSSVMRPNFGKIRFANKGATVDLFYDELNAKYPGFFPADIINPSDQLQRIIEVANMSVTTEQVHELDGQALDAVTDSIVRSVNEYRREQRNAAAEANSRAAFNSLMADADRYAPVEEGDIAPVRADVAAEPAAEPVAEPVVEPAQESAPKQIKNVKERLAAKLQNLQTELAENQRLRMESHDAYELEIARLQAEYDGKRDKNTKAANNLLRRIARLRRVQNDTDVGHAKRISDLEAQVAKASEEARKGESPEAQRAMRQELHASIVESIRFRMAERGIDFDEMLRNAKDLSTLATVDNTPQRVMEKALGYKEGQALADLTVNQVAKHETEGIRWLNGYTNRKTGLLAQISKQYRIKPGSKESAAAQMYAEGFYVADNGDIIAYGDRELAADFPDANVQANIKGLARDPRIRQIYDATLAMINESRARNAYPEIQRLDNYFLHFRAMDDTFSRLGIPFNPNDIKAKDLPTDLNGVTADLKPGQPYFASAMHRKGKRTSFDMLGGLERYLTSAKGQIYHIDDIQTLRALRNHIADTFGQAHGLEGLDTMTEEEAASQIEQVYDAHLSTFAKFLNEEANVIAGKTALIDRGLEGIIGRRGMTFFDTLNRQVGANMVGFNVSSSLTNFIAPVQAFAKTNKAAFVKGFAQTVANRIGSITGKGDGFAENNPTMIRRQGADRFYRTPWQKAGDLGYALMGAVDSLSTEIIVRSKYNELVGKGMSHEQAVEMADKWASRLMGDRSLGQQPQLYNSKMLGLFTKFQLEVRNQLDSQFYDTIQEAKVSAEDIQNKQARNAKIAAQVTSTFVQLAVVQHLFGKAFEAVAGYNPAFDIIEAIVKAFGWDDEEDSEDTVLDNLGQGFMNLLEDMPYSSVATGGRIPISAALPIGQLIKGEDKYGNEKSRLETVAEAAPYYLLPGGYGQIKKTAQGLGMFDDDLPIAGSYTDSGNLRYPVEDTLANRAQAAVFGQYANANARDYFNNERQSLKKNQIQELVDVDIPIREYWDYRDGLKEQETLADKFDYIAGLDLPIDKKNILINNVVDRKEAVDLTDYDDYASYEEFDFAVKNPEKYDFLQNMGVSVAEYQSFDDDTKDAYDWAYQNPEKYTLSRAVTDDVAVYRQYTKALNEIKADKYADGRTVNGSRKTKVLGYLNNLDADYYTKIILFKMEYNADDTYNREIIEYLNGRSDISFEEEVTILRELGFTVTADGTVRW